jgi:MerR family mercuric resistance operon transcriptional regulator
MERVLKDVVVQCADGTLPECPLIETLFRGISNTQTDLRKPAIDNDKLFGTA